MQVVVMCRRWTVHTVGVSSALGVSIVDGRYASLLGGVLGVGGYASLSGSMSRWAVCVTGRYLSLGAVVSGIRIDSPMLALTRCR